MCPIQFSNFSMTPRGFIIIRVVFPTAERDGPGRRGEPSQLWDAGLHAHQAIVRQHVEGLWILLAEACHLHCGHRLHWVHLPQRRHQIQLHPGKQTRTIFFSLTLPSLFQALHSFGCPELALCQV